METMIDLIGSQQLVSHSTLFKQFQGDDQFLSSIKSIYLFGSESPTASTTSSFDRESALILTVDDLVYALGSNENSILGVDNNCNPIPLPQIVPQLCHKNIVEFSAGKKHVIARTQAGQIWSWGSNKAGQLGRTTTSQTQESQPGLVAFEDDVKSIVQIATGAAYCLALTSDGHVYAWGSNTMGQCGQSDNAVTSFPSKITLDIPQGAAIKAIACGAASSYALSTTGQLFAWGSNKDGQLGLGHYRAIEMNPVQVQVPSPVKQIVAGDDFMVLLDKSCSVWAFGANKSGQLGFTQPSVQRKPKQLSTTGFRPKSRVTKLMTFNHSTTVCLTECNHVYIWGQIKISGSDKKVSIQPSPKLVKCWPGPLINLMRFQMLTVTQKDQSLFNSSNGHSNGNNHLEVTDGQSMTQSGSSSPSIRSSLSQLSIASDSGFGISVNTSPTSSQAPTQNLLDFTAIRLQAKNSVRWLGTWKNVPFAFKYPFAESASQSEDSNKQASSVPTLAELEQLKRLSHMNLIKLRVIVPSFELSRSNNGLLSCNGDHHTALSGASLYHALHWEAKNALLNAATKSPTLANRKPPSSPSPNKRSPSSAPPFTLSMVLEWLTDLANGLAYLHDHKLKPIIHGRLCSKNIILCDKFKTLIITDLELIGDEADPCYMLAYQPPEQLLKPTSTDLTPATDIYAFGILIWEILSHSVPYTDGQKIRSQQQLTQLIISKGMRPAKMTNCPHRVLIALMKDAWTRDPRRRPNIHKIETQLGGMKSIYAKFSSQLLPYQLHPTEHYLA